MNSIEIFKRFLARANLDVKQHQLEGVEWMVEKELYPEDKENIGGICADEMGLGKTIQMLGLIVSNLKPNTLIVVPVNLLSQWEHQIEKNFGFKPLVYYGNAKKEIDNDLLKLAPITLTTYGQLCSDLCDLFDLKWSRVIYDEAHHMKNKNTKLYAIQSKLIRTYTWLVTGTPVQNKLTDLKNLFNLIGLKDIRKKYEAYIDSYILKRTKQECNVVLPKVTTKIINVPFEHDIESLTYAEKNISKELHSSLSFMNINLEDDPKLISNYLQTLDRLPLLIQCRQMCIMPKMLQNKLQSTKDICSFNDDYYMFSEAVESSSKLNKMCQDIEKNKNGRSKLIFCSYRMEIDYLYKSTLMMGYNVEKIDGRTTSVQRKNILANSYDILILQISTCSEGINLQKYSEIYIASPSWNPATEDQAIGRCHRIGQTQEVFVYKYFMETFDTDGKDKTLDNHIDDIQKFKRDIYI